MLSIGLLVHAQHLTGSFAAAGLVDRRATPSPSASAARCSAASSTAAARPPCCSPRVRRLRGAARRRRRCCPAGAPLALVVALAAGIGLATPPVGACVRTLLPGLVDERRGRVAYAVDATAVELTWVSGPPLALRRRRAVSRPARRWPPRAPCSLLGTVRLRRAPGLARLAPGADRERAAPAARCARPAMRTLVIVLIGRRRAVRRRRGRRRRGRRALEAPPPRPAAGRLGRRLAGRRHRSPPRRGGGAHTAAGLALLLACLAAGHLALAAAAGTSSRSPPCSSSPAPRSRRRCASVYAMVERAAPAGHRHRGVRLAGHRGRRRRRGRRGRRRRPRRARRSRAPPSRSPASPAPRAR